MGLNTPMRHLIQIITEGDDPAPYPGEDFTEWFRGSVIEDNGEPLIAHHFTYFDFDQFDRHHGTRHFKRDPERIDAIGIWFTLNHAAHYVKKDWGGKRMDCYLSIKNPMTIDDVHHRGEGSAFDVLRNMVVAAGGATAFRDQAKSQGYDGIFLPHTKLDRWYQTVVIVFEPEQIRIAHVEPDGS